MRTDRVGRVGRHGAARRGSARSPAARRRLYFTWTRQFVVITSSGHFDVLQ